MQWLRWYRGTVEDAKFRFVAAQAGVPISTAIAVWAVLLEDAASDDHRGTVTRDEDWIATILELDDGIAERVMSCMARVNLISVGIGGITILNWNRRQFESDRDSTAAERQKRYRKRLKKKRDEHNARVTRDKRVSHGRVTRPESETETDTETENKKEGIVPLPAADAASPPPQTDAEDNGLGTDDAAAVANYWNNIAETLGLPCVRRMTKQRRQKAVARLKEAGTLLKMAEIMDSIGHQPFLLGRNDRQWKADFDWFLEPRNFVKVEERKYANGHA